MIASAALIIVLAQKWSTHQIEWRPLVHKDIEDEVEEGLEKEAEEDSKILKDALDLQRSKKKAKESVDPLDSILESNNY